MRARAATELRDRILTGRLAPGDAPRSRPDHRGVRHQPHPRPRGAARAVLRGARRGHAPQRHHRPRHHARRRGRQLRRARRPPGKAAEWATARITPEQLAELRDAGRRHRRRRRRRRRRQPALPPRAQPRRRLAPPAHLPAPGRAGGARQLLRALPRAGAAQPSASTPRCSTPSSAGDAAAARTIAEAHVLDAGEALGDWLRTHARP